MNTKSHNVPAADARAYANVVVLPARRDDRREFGTGYGRSSGYADGLRRYANREAGAKFRVH